MPGSTIVIAASSPDPIVEADYYRRGIEIIADEPKDEEPAPAPEIQLPHPRDEMAGSPADVPPLAEAPPPVMHAPEGDSMPLWTPSMDSVLLWSWESGVDLQTVASELGVSVRALLMRVQALADDGMITLANPVPDAVRSGRHRRQYEETTSALFAATSAFPAYMPY